MKNIVNTYIEKYKERHRKFRRTVSMWMSLALIVTVGVFWQLHSIGIALTGDNLCGMTEHQHSDECYEPVLICGMEEGEGHIHGETCYETETVLICDLEETEGHSHSGDCYDEEGNLVCGMEETEGHSHGDECYMTEQVLVCGLEESEGHTHGDECYEMQLVCGLEEHIHSVECMSEEESEEEIYEEETDSDTEELSEEGTGSEEETEGETESESEKETDSDTEETTSELSDEGSEEETAGEEAEEDGAGGGGPNTTADYESVTDLNWEDSLPELTNIWADDVVAIAESQLGYEESLIDYVLGDDGETHKGYTIYGDWAGNPYGDWDAMFAAYCLSFADVSEDYFPEAAGAYGWAVKLAEAEDFGAPGEYEPLPGDLVFFDTDDTGYTNRVGIVTAAGETGLTVIEGNYNDAVCENRYDLNDGMITGFGILPEQPGEDEKPEEEKPYTLEYEGDDYIVTVGYDDDAGLPEGVELAVSEYDKDSETYSAHFAEAVKLYGWDAEDEELSAAYRHDFRLFNISLYFEGEETEPEAAVSVVIAYKDAVKAGEYQATHFDDESKAEDMGAASAYEDGIQMISFDTEGFSDYGISLVSAEAATAVTSLTQISGSGSYYLASDITVSSGITISGDVTIDLNGYTITYTGSDRLFSVSSGGELTITDSASSITDTKKAVSSNTLYGNTATTTANSDGSYTLVYYVTESEANSDGTTTETLYKHTVTVPAESGKIICENAIDGPIYAASGGTINIEGGYIYNAGSHIVVTQWSGYYRNEASGSEVNISGGYLTGASGNAVYMGNGTLNMSGGYIAGNSASNGGGVYVYGDYGSEFNMTGGVIAANTGTTSGGGVYMEIGTFNMSDGVISGNTAGVSATGRTYRGGGGVYIAGGDMTISGGYITNNNASDFSSEGGGSTGGGGIYFASGSGTLTMSGGYVTGNYAADAGGGIYAGYGYFIMTGGTVANNVAEDGEGGGLRIGLWNANVVAVIEATSGSSVYITNNISNTEYSWGGGGIFVTDGNTLTIISSVITDNSAGGFGGGVAGCSTSRVYVLDEGSAVYDNTADGVNLTGSSEKTEDHSAAANSVFMNSGYEDFFCAMNSIVYDRMLGDGSANWTGSCDYVYIEIAEGGAASASTMMGLTADPTSADKTAAFNEASVYITGNYAYTHGGGIMSNGILLMGKATDIVVSPGLTIYGTKLYQIYNSSNRTTTTGTLTAGQFTFLLLDEKPTVSNGVLTYDEDSVVETATNTAAGDLLFALSYGADDWGTSTDSVKTFTYYLIEKNDGSSSMDYDSTYYTITVTVTRTTDTWTVSSTNDTINVTYYIVTGITVTKNGSGTATYSVSNVGLNNHTASVTIGDSSNATFTNTGESGKVAVTVNKSWQDAGYTSDRAEVTVELYKNGEATGQTVTLNNTNGWTATFSDLDKYVLDSKGKPTSTVNTYTVVETTDLSNYTWTVSEDSDGTENFAYTITNIHDIKLLKTDSRDDTLTLSGAEFTLMNSEGKYYKLDGDTASWVIVASGDEPPTITTDSDGAVSLKGLEPGTYTLTEVTAPEGYSLLTFSVTLTVSDSGKVTVDDGTGAVEVSDNGLQITVKNTAGNELPSAGGMGIWMYIIIDLILCGSAVYLVLRRFGNRA